MSLDNSNPQKQNESGRFAHQFNAVGPAAESPLWSAITGIYLTLASLLLVYLLLMLWPREVLQQDGMPVTPVQWIQEVTLLGGYKFTLDNEIRILLVVLLSGALGSMIHALKSFIAYTGAGSFKRSWIWWYILRAPLGGALALVFYLAIRGGLLAKGAAGTEVSVFGIGAIASLVGLFTEQATNKLKEVFDTLFSTSKSAEGPDQLIQPRNVGPKITGLSPERLEVGTRNRVLTVNGQNFEDGCSVRLDGQPRPTEWNNYTRLRVTLKPEDVESPGEKNLTIINPNSDESQPVQMIVVGGS